MKPGTRVKIDNPGGVGDGLVGTVLETHDTYMRRKYGPGAYVQLDITPDMKRTTVLFGTRISTEGLMRRYFAWAEMVEL